MKKNIIEEVFAVNVFNDAAMAEKLPKKVYEQLKNTIENDEDLDSSIAGVVAHAMKEWALEKGATHYSHWFQPMTGITAEKNDSFISPRSDGKAVLEFSSKELVKGESDASSFPSGGLRATFEARGYTAWDCTSPAFVREDAAGVTLCIPTAFCSYTGEALDKKTPLLRSMEAISDQSIRILKLFGYDDVKRVSVSVGAEQEYFLVDKEKYLQREDLKFTGRTLFGAMPPKGQELDDHYFGSLKERIASFMHELNIELWKVGVLAKTQHNEVAPAQHELAPIYATANIATDHNQITMEIMKKVAKRHGLECLLHEKPFKGVNGSGKHDNWSLVTDTGMNILNPGKKPHENKLFLLFLAAIMSGVDDHAGILRLSASNPGNDHRLGADEAPPAIISMFLGSQLEDVLLQLIENGEATSSIKGEKMDVGVHTLPIIKKDATDRNRTSPFAFTGNKFEFRSVASSMSIAGPNTVLNTIVANALSDIADKLEKVSKEDFDDEVNKITKKLVSKHKRILFGGDGYSKEWVEEAERRGLPNFKTMVDSVEELVSEKTIEVFEKMHVLSKTELLARAEINYEAYTKAINIEAKTMLDMTFKKYMPAIIKFEKRLADTIISLKKACGESIDVSVESGLLKECSKLLRETQKQAKNLEKLHKKGKNLEDGKDKAFYFKEKVLPAMEKLRAPVDKLELIVDKELWPVPSYGDMLYEV